MKIKIKFKGKDVLIDDVKKVSSLGKITGLMFRGMGTSALLFEFGKGKKAIHSFFCNSFLAIWVLDGKVVDYKLVKPFQPSIKPKSDYTQLIEVPLNSKYTSAIEFFLGEGKV